MGSGYIGEELDLEQVDNQIGRGRRRNDPQSGDNNNKGGDINLYSQLWHACAGPFVNVSRTGDKVYYFPQGHIEQVATYMDQDGNTEMPIYKIPCKILCKVVNVDLKAEAKTDEVFAQVTLLPLAEEPISDGANSSSQLHRSPARAFIKRLTPSDRSMHGGFSIPKRYAKDFFPPLDMSQETPTQELVAKDLHGTKWKFHHIYRGQPKRHLITSGWSKFLADKKLNAGDSSVFVSSGENGELYVGIHRATRPEYSASATVLSSLSVQHGILATACHAVSSGSMFTVYYRPWSGSADFVIPYDQYMKSAEIDYSVGTRFRMQFGSDKCSEHKSQVYGGAIVGVEDVDCVRWRDSEWRSLKVQWDFISDVHVLPERVSHWSIEPIGVAKKRRIIAPYSHSKRAHPSDSSTTQIPFVLKKDILESPAGYTHRTHSGVLQGQEIRAVGASEQGTSAQPILPHWNLQPNPGQGQLQISITGNQNHQPSEIRDPLSLGPGSSVSFPDENSPNFELGNLYCAIVASKGNSVEVSRSLPVPNVNFISPKSEYWRASEKGDGKEVGQTQPNASGKFMLFGANLSKSPLKLLSPQTVVSTEHTSLSSVPPAICQPIFSEAIHVSDPSKGDYRNLPENQLKNYWSFANRTCTKVLRYGTALGRSVDLRRFFGYKELVFELDKLFDFNGALAGEKNGWSIIYEDREGDMLLVGDCLWPEFRGMVRKMFIYPMEEVYKMNTRTK